MKINKKLKRLETAREALLAKRIDGKSASENGNNDGLIDGVVMRKGERILVKIRRPGGRPVRRRRQGTFVMVPLQWAAELAEITGTRKSLAWLSLLFAAWEAKGQPFVFSNDKLIGKCSREFKRRVLSELKAAGWIKVEQKGKRAPIVTILKPDCLSQW